MRDRSLVAFTLLTQMAVGMFWAVTLVWWVMRGPPGAAGGFMAGLAGPASRAAALAPLLAVGPLIAVAATISLLHLGTPQTAWRALGNLRSSWLSREILFLALFGGGWAVVAGLILAGGDPAGGAAAVAPLATTPPPTEPVMEWAVTVARVLALWVAVVGGGLVYSMARVYRLRTVPAWDTALTPAAFFLTAGSLGGLAAALVMALVMTSAVGPGGVPRGLVLLAGLCVAAELWLEPAWWARRRAAAVEVDPGLYPEARERAATAVRRPALLVIALAFIVVVSLGAGHVALIAAALVAALAAGVVGRVGFYGSYARRGV